MFPLKFESRYRYINQWARFNLWWLRVTCGVSGDIQGQENIPDSAAILFSKHQSTWETLTLQRVFPLQVWVLKKELLKVPFFGWGLAMLEPIAIDRGAGRKAVDQVVEQGIERLNKGRWVVIFPEGTRVAPGKRGRYRAGGALLAERSGYPVVPVAHNAGEYWPRHQFIKRPGVIKVRIGPPIITEGKSSHQIMKEAEEWIESTMKEITSRPDLYAHEVEQVDAIPDVKETSK